MKKIINCLLVSSFVVSLVYGMATAVLIASDREAFQNYKIEKVVDSVDESDALLLLLNEGIPTNSMKEKAEKAKYKSYITYVYDSAKDMGRTIFGE